MGAPGYVQGHAMADPSVLRAHQEAWGRISRTIDRSKAVISTEPKYGHTVYILDSALTAGLTDLEKVVLAYGGTVPFGGSVSGTRVEVFND